MINGEILKAVKTARAVFHPLSKARKTELRSCFSGAFKLSNLSCNVHKSKKSKHLGNSKFARVVNLTSKLSRCDTFETEIANNYSIFPFTAVSFDFFFAAIAIIRLETDEKS
jgi:hypothetical protein